MTPEISGTEEAQAVNVALAALLERLKKRAKEDEACAENSRVVADLLAPEMAKFKSRDDAGWNTYAVRMAVDHQNSVRREAEHAADLRAAIATIASAREVITAFLVAHDDGPGLIDCIDNHDERYTSQFLCDAIGAARDWQGR